MVKEGSSDYKKVSKRWFFKEALTEWFFVETKNGSSMASLEEPFEAPLFLRVYTPEHNNNIHLLLYIHSVYIYIYIYIYI